MIRQWLMGKEKKKVILLIASFCIVFDLISAAKVTIAATLDEKVSIVVRSAIKHEKANDKYHDNAFVQFIRLVFFPLVPLSFILGKYIFIPVGILSLFGVVQLESKLRLICLYFLLGALFLSFF